MLSSNRSTKSIDSALLASSSDCQGFSAKVKWPTYDSSADTREGSNTLRLAAAAALVLTEEQNRGAKTGRLVIGNHNHSLYATRACCVVTTTSPAEARRSTPTW